MHRYLKSIGFSQIHTIREQEQMLSDVLRHYDFKKVVEDAHGQLFVQISREYAMDMGVTVCGYYDEENLFHMEHHFPYFMGSQVTTCQQLGIERHSATESYVGACEDPRVGTTLIFYLLNAGDYMNITRDDVPWELNASLSLSGLADTGMILLPLEKAPEQRAKQRRQMQRRDTLYNAAAKGDQHAMESLTMEEIDAYTMIARRIQHEDVYTIVDSFFMPYGLECDQYSVMGDIVDWNTVRNSATGEEVCQLDIVSNEIPISICINAHDLTGEPEIGRRFKGQVWLQGMVNF